MRPPKKSWKKIFNLSGGEKTLSSLALVFALHHYKPTPLYFMDEIDAALDFKNVSIVACYIYVSMDRSWPQSLQILVGSCLIHRKNYKIMFILIICMWFYSCSLNKSAQLQPLSHPHILTDPFSLY